MLVGMSMAACFPIFAIDTAEAVEKYPVQDLVFRYEALPYSKLLPKEQARTFLQRFANTVWGRGFLYLGEERDFFHGHFLFHASRDNPAGPLAILWHTQENAGQGDMDYVNRWGRNWVQFYPDGASINNALALQNLQLGEKFWRTFFRQYTVFSEMLDIAGPVEERYGTPPETDALIDPYFVRVPCTGEFSKLSEEHNQIRITLPNRDVACLLLLSAQCFSAYTGYYRSMNHCPTPAS